MRILSTLLAVTILLPSCSGGGEVPSDVLPKKKMQEVLLGMISAGEFLDGYALRKDSIDKMAEKARVYSEVFEVYHVTKDEFDKSYKYYREHPELMKEILDSLTKRLTSPLGQPQLRDTSRLKMVKPTE